MVSKSSKAFIAMTNVISIIHVYQNISPLVLYSVNIVDETVFMILLPILYKWFRKAIRKAKHKQIFLNRKVSTAKLDGANLIPGIYMV